MTRGQRAWCAPLGLIAQGEAPGAVAVSDITHRMSPSRSLPQALAAGVVALAAVQWLKFASSVAASMLKRSRSAQLARDGAARAERALAAGFAQPLAGGFDATSGATMIERPELLGQIMRSMHEPRASTSSYYIVSGVCATCETTVPPLTDCEETDWARNRSAGAPGAGKTTVLRQACSRLAGVRHTRNQAATVH